MNISRLHLLKHGLLNSTPQSLAVKLSLSILSRAPIPVLPLLSTHCPTFEIVVIHNNHNSTKYAFGLVASALFHSSRCRGICHLSAMIPATTTPITLTETFPQSQRQRRPRQNHLHRTDTHHPQTDHHLSTRLPIHWS